MRIKAILKQLFYKFLPKEEKFIKEQLCGVSLNVLPGTIRNKVDQDDAWWFYLCKHHDVIFDVGCNIGYTSLLALIQNEDRKIILIDPNPKALQYAAMNIVENGIGNKAHYVCAFMGNKVNENVKFYTVGSGAAGSMHASHAETAASLNEFINVKTITLDYLYDYYQLAPHLVKIDVEGAETLVMEASKKLAKETQCAFFIEMHNVEGLGMEAAGQVMINWCKELDYKVWYLKKGEELLSAKTIAGRGKCHLLLLPKNKQYPEYLKEIAQGSPLPKTM